MSYNDPHLLQKQNDCLKLYLEHNGSDHDVIEQKMREMGWTNFSHRILHNRNYRGKHVKGWIDALGWKQILINQFLELGYEPIKPETDWTASVPLAGKVLSSATSSGVVALDTGKRDDSDPVDSTVEVPVNAFHAWLQKVSPELKWDAEYHKYICRQLERMDRGEIKRMMVFVPPRHGKSELVTVRYAAWTLKNDPSKNVIVASYGQKLANNFSRKIKRILGHDWELKKKEEAEATTGMAEPTGAASIPACHACSSGVTTSELEKSRDFNPSTSYSVSTAYLTSGCGASLTADQVYAGGTDSPSCTCHRAGEQDARPPVEECPFPFVSDRPKNTEAEWETTKGGGLRAVGVGGGITGFGADLIIVDDPVKSRAEAESKTRREGVWDWFNDDVMTRLEPDGNIILIQTRWHEDDLAGRLLRQTEEGETEPWTVINLPAIATGKLTSGAPKSEPEAIATGSSESEPRAIATGSTVTTRSAEIDDSIRQSDPKPRAMGFPPLYSRVKDEDDWTASVPLACEVSKLDRDADFLGVTASRDEAQISEELAPCISSGEQDAHPPVVNGVASKRDDCGPVLGDQIGRVPGESLWPWRYSVRKLEQRRQQIGTYSFSALYQQRPVPAEGGLFKREWFSRIITAPPAYLKWIRGYDLGVVSSEDSDFTASFRVAFDDEENLYIDGGVRRRMEFPEQRRFILSRIATERNTVHIVEGTHNGSALVQAITSERPGRRHLLKVVKVREPKEARAVDWINIAEQGRMYLIRAAWNQEFIDECCSFPLGTHDDQVDAVSLAVRAAKRVKSNKLHKF